VAWRAIIGQLRSCYAAAYTPSAHTHVATQTAHAHFVVVAIVIGVVIDCRMMVMRIEERGRGARREEGGGVAAIDWLLTAAARVGSKAAGAAAYNALVMFSG
jgi:hypothetical protein